jgi:hypothetical protein
VAGRFVCYEESRHCLPVKVKQQKSHEQLGVDVSAFGIEDRDVWGDFNDGAHELTIFSVHHDDGLVATRRQDAENHVLVGALDHAVAPVANSSLAVEDDLVEKDELPPG